MTSYLVLLGIICGIPLQSVMIKQNQKRGAKGSVFLFAAATALFAMLCFALIEGNAFVFSKDFVPYSFGFALAYGICFCFEISALSCGPMSLTLLIQSYSLLLPTFYGILFLNETAGATFWIGIALLALCLFLTYFDKNGIGEKISLKWGIYVTLAFLGNGMCSVIQKMQTTEQGTAYQNEFMILALAMITVCFAAVGLVREKKELSPFLKRGWYWGALCGIFNGGVNFGVLILADQMPASVQFPLISAGSIIAAALFSQFLYKEHLTPRQWVGFCVGILSVVCLNI